MAESESSIQKRVHLALSHAGSTMFRNETGNFWAGKVIHKADGQVTISNARMVQCGLCKGSSDLAGWTPVTITPEMVGKTVAVFTAAEIKTPQGRTTKEQDKFLLAVNRAGGLGFVARSVDDALDALKK